jgi:hypothetical protein
MIIKINHSTIGELNNRVNQVISIARHTNTRSPVVQSTTTRGLDESYDAFITRLHATIRNLIAPYGYEHHVVLHCREKHGTDALTDDEYQNISRKLWFISVHSPNQAERVKALSVLLDMHQ